jgi:hypothetical protein
MFHDWKTSFSILSSIIVIVTLVHWDLGSNPAHEVDVHPLFLCVVVL